MQYNIIDLILTHLKLFSDNLSIQYTKMIKKILYRAFYKKKSLNSMTFKRLNSNLKFIEFNKVNISSSQIRNI